MKPWILLLVLALIACKPQPDPMPSSGAPCSPAGAKGTSANGVQMVCNADNRWQARYFTGGTR